MGRKVLLLALGGLCLTPLFAGSMRVSSQALPQEQRSSESRSPTDTRCAKADDCPGEKWNAATRGCGCAPSGICTQSF